MASQEHIEYNDSFVAALETIWGDGFLSPGGLFLASDWMRRDAHPPSAEMKRYLEFEDLNFEMMPPVYYEQALVAAGFEEVVIRDRNRWYAELARKEHQEIKGTLYPTLVEKAGKAEADRLVGVWQAMCVVLDSGELRPAHMRAKKP